MAAAPHASVTLVNPNAPGLIESDVPNPKISKIETPVSEQLRSERGVHGRRETRRQSNGTGAAGKSRRRGTNVRRIPNNNMLCPPRLQCVDHRTDVGGVGRGCRRKRLADRCAASNGGQRISHIIAAAFNYI